MGELGGFSRDVVLWSGGYCLLLILLGILGRRAMRERTLSDFYLAGRSIGFLVLLLTLFATQYSGNSMSGFPGQTYRQGLAYFMSVTFMVGIVSGYTLFVPRLFRLARQRKYVTPTDFLADRFGSPALNYASATILTVTLFNFLLAQLMAMGHAFAGLTDGRIPYGVAVVGGAAVILGYELLGGMRAVAWTDALQGSMLLVGMMVVVGLLIWEVGPPGAVVSQLAALHPEKVANPGLATCAVWLSNFLLLGLGAPLYPQAIQRIYAARHARELRRALSVMALLPLVGITAVIYVGTVGLVLFPKLEGVAADQVTFKVLAYLAQQEPLAYYPVLVVMMAVVAAIMSTADSCLLSISSIFTKDFFGRLRRLPPERVEGLTRLAPLVSTVVMAGLVWIALQKGLTLWGLLVIKFEILIQLSPAFVLGTWHDRDDPRAFQGRDILLGLTAGLGTALGLYAAGFKSVGGFHPGTVGVILNYALVFAARAGRGRR